ncbi:hypothetical protein LSPH24S_06284 [Lysinibacillus sphaericus]
MFTLKPVNFNFRHNSLPFGFGAVYYGMCDGELIKDPIVGYWQYS